VNGLPRFRPYVYNGPGAGSLTAFMDDEPVRRRVRVRRGKVHLGRDGGARCGNGATLTTNLADVTCGACRNMAAGTHGFLGRATERSAA
jgi:hypothetical protein